MWVLMILSMLLAWIYPFQVLLTSGAWICSLPSLWVVAFFWGMYACVDVILYAPALVQHAGDRFRSFFTERKKARLVHKHLELVLMVLQKDKTLLKKNVLHLKPMNADQALAYAILASAADHKDTHLYIRENLQLYFPKDAVKLQTLLYAYTMDADSACKVATSLFFIGKMPLWLEQWAQSAVLSSSVLAEIVFPEVSVHASWHPFLHRIIVAKILASHTLEDMHNVLTPYVLSSKNPLVRWALLERIYTLGLEKSLDAFGNVFVESDPFKEFYAWLYSAENAAFWQWRELGDRFRACMKAYDIYCGIETNALTYFDALSHWDSQPQLMGRVLMLQTQQYMHRALLKAAGIKERD